MMNIRLSIYVFFVFGLLACNSSKIPNSSSGRDDPRIAIVEKSLTPGIRIKGDTTTYTLAQRMDHYGVPGVSIALIEEGELQWAKGYGYADKKGRREVTPLTRFQAASISKPVGTMIALRMVDQGQLDLDEDVNAYLQDDWRVPENDYTSSVKVTLRRLMTHSAGLTVHGFRGYAEGEEVPSLVQILKGEDPANSDAIVADTFPSSLRRYSGGGYTVMQKVVQDQTGLTFDELARQWVLAPIGMNHSTYEQPLPDEWQAVASYGYRGDGKMVAGRWHTYPEQAAAGLWTTPSDLARYVIEVQRSLAGASNRVLSQDMTRQMLTEGELGHGLGPGLRGEGEELIFSHSGANEGFRCVFVAWAHQGKGAVIMTNSDNGGSLMREILNSISTVYSWDEYAPKEKVRMEFPQTALSEFSGQYEFAPEFVVTFKEGDGVLEAHQSWDDKNYVLYPEAEDQFFTLDDSEKFFFTRDETGQIIGLLVDDYYELRKVD